MGKGGMASMGLERRVGKHRHRPVAQCAALVVALALLLVAPSVAAATVLPSTIKENTTLAPAGNPYTGTSTIESGVTLTVQPDVKFKANAIIVKGTLKAEGTAEEPIVFTGDEEKAWGEWQNIKFEPGSGKSVLDHVEVKYGGFISGSGGVEISAASPTITNSVFYKNKGYGILSPDGGSPEIAANSFSANGGSSAIRYAAGNGESGEINIHDNDVEYGNGGIYVGINGTGSAVGTDLSGNTIVGTSGTGLTYSGPDIPTNITENTLIANSNNGIYVDGTVAHSSTWKDAGTLMHLSSDLTIAAGVTLSIQPGVVLLPKAIIVKGTLKAEGTAEEPIVFTGDEEKTTGEWKNIKFESGSGASVLNYVEVKFGGSPSNSGAIESNGPSIVVTNSTLSRNQYYAIKVLTGSPKIEWNRFRGGANGLTFNGTGTLAAPNNDWGCASGPKPAGCGSSVNSKVDWKPAVQLPEPAAHCRGKGSQCGEGADPVSLATGQLSYSHRDLLLTNKGKAPLELTRAYSSGSAVDTGFGPGWSQAGLANATELASGDVLIQRQDGRQDLFDKAEAGFTAPSGVTDTLAKVEGTFRLTTLQGTVSAFDSSGRIASITDDHGLKTTYAYNAEGRLATITDPSAQTLTFSYNASNHITLVKDSTGREVKYTYSAAGDLATVTDALGGVTEYTYDAEHRLKTIKDPRGNVILKNTFDGQGRIIEQRDGLENLWKLEYKAAETIVTEPEGGKITYGFDGRDRVVSEKDQLGNTTTTSYDKAGNVDEVVTPGGAKWQFGHDAKGNLTSVIDPEEGERSYEYDGKNRLTSFTDEREETWTYEWSEANDLKRATDPAEGDTTATYNASGQPLTITDPNEHTTTFTYDSRGNRLTAKDALEHTTAFAYDTRNYLTSKTLSGLKAEAFGRNSLGDLLSVTTPLGNKAEYTYDANGMLTQVTDPAKGVWKVTRDAMERPIAYLDPFEQKTEVDYDGNLHPISITDRRGKETTYGYDLANQLTAVSRPEGGDWEFGYDARGNTTSVIDPREGETAYQYDLLDRMTEATEPLETVSSYEYDPAGNLTSFTDPRENTTDLAYDELSRLTDLKQPLGKTTSFAYDGVGNRTSRTTAEGTVEFEHDAANRLDEISAASETLRSFGYDAADRLTSAVDAQSDEVEVGYDEDGRIVAIDDGRGQTVSRKYDSRDNLIEQTDGRGKLSYVYDKLNRMTSLVDPQSKTLGFSYDAEGNLTGVELPNGVVTTSAYDDAGRLAKMTSKAGEVALESLEYEYDPFGNRISQADRLSQETTYSYDALNRLTEFDPPGEGSTAYGYDAAGNRTEAGAITYGFDDLNRLTEASDGTTYEYDNAGRLAEVDDGFQVTTYAWNSLDELAGVNGESQEATYAYDAFGRQAVRDNGSTIRSSHYGDLSDVPILDTDAEGMPTMSYVQGPEGMVEQRAGGATSFPLPDVHGDITTIANVEGGVASRQTYDPWGAPISGPELEMGYLGAQQRRSDPATGLIQMGARPYNPALGSFVAEDPILGHLGVSVTLNRYPYAGNNPLLYFDLNGRDFLDDVGGVIGETWNSTGGAGWDKSAGTRTALGVAGDGNGGWLSETPGFTGERAQDFWKATGNYVTSCLGNAAWGAASGAAIGATAAGAGAIPGAIGGGLSGCGVGLVEQGLEDAGQDTAADVLDIGTAAKDVGKGAKTLGKEAPELPERLKDMWDVFF